MPKVRELVKKTGVAVTKNTVLAIMDQLSPLAAFDPYVFGTFFACKVAIASFFDLYPEEAKPFWSEVRLGMDQLTGEPMSSEEFQQSLVITFETLLRTREKRKRELIKKIFINGYISDQDRHDFDLERFYRVAHEISVGGLEYLKFISDVIMPIKLKWATAEVAKMNGNHEGSVEWWIKRTLQGESDSKVITKWIYQEYDPNSEAVKSTRLPNQDEKDFNAIAFEKERGKLDQYAEVASEFVSLGIFRERVEGGGMMGGGAGAAQSMTEFGHKFMEFVKLVG